MANGKQEEWVKEKELGTGGFGQVTLWKHAITGEFIAVKKCRLKSDLTQKHRDRWQCEVDIMGKLDHPNVVRALPTPSMMAPAIGDPAILVMEYCAGGDLRQVLTNTACGMKESSLRHFVRNIAGGVEYLHKKRIIHRDLKPENIVISRSGPGENEITYKIIDLGYAKELNETSICSSFVGTMQYLAPELMSQKDYTRTVDFWSFGVVLFECITGVRPFLPSDTPVKWHEQVSKKSPDDICLYYNFAGNVVSSKQISMPNWLCRTSRAFFEQFLRLMLQWDPKSRGGKTEHGNRDKCWSLLDNILDSPLLFIYCVPTNELLTYPVEDKHTINDVQRALERETKIPIAQQELLQATGATPDIRTQARSFIGADEDVCLYLYRKYTDPNMPLLPQKPLDDTPEFLQYMINEPESILNHQDQVKFMSQAAFFCAYKAKQFSRIVNASKAVLHSLMRETTAFNNQRNTMMTEVGKLMTLVDFSEQGLKEDINSYETQLRESQQSISNKKIIQSWHDMKAKVLALKQLDEEAKPLYQECMLFQTRMVELQRNPFVSGGGQAVVISLNQTADQALRHYMNLRKKHKSDVNKPENKDVLQCVYRAQKEKEEKAEEIHVYLRLLMQRKADMATLSPQVTSLISKISDAREQLKEFQRKRQHDMWRFISFALNDNSRRSNPSAAFTGAGAALQTSMMLHQHSMDSIKVLSENANAKKRCESLVSNGESSGGNWSFLSSMEEAS